MADALISPAVQVLLDKLVSFTISELGKLYGVRDEIKRLKRTMDRLRAVLCDADQHNVVDRGQQATLWLREIKGVLYDTEDLLEEVLYQHLSREVINCRPSGTLDGSSSYRCSFLFPCTPAGDLGKFCSHLSPHAVSFRYKMARKIDSIRRRLDEIAEDKTKLGLKPVARANQEVHVNNNLSVETGGTLELNRVVGRDEMMNQLIELLTATTTVTTASSSRAGSSSPFSVVSIVGMGGLGKTTLAKLVFNSERVEDHFPIKVWSFVSRDFKVVEKTRDVLQQVNPDTALLQQSSCTLHVLQEKLSENLKGRRFLLVCDDVWEENTHTWTAFTAPFVAKGEKGSKILITSRHDTFPKMLDSEIINLAPLSPDETWLIFKDRAFTEAHSDRFNVFEPIGREIVEKLKGVPLSAVTVGDLLRAESADERKWREVLDSKLWELEAGEGRILPSLMLSYVYLPAHLKQCFAYLSVFPKGYTFDNLDLVQHWMAQGYIYVKPDGNMTEEDMGMNYLQKLLSRSLVIQHSPDSFTIHDLLHDLGLHILGREYHGMELDDQMGKSNAPDQDAPPTIHLAVYYPKPHEGKMEALYKFRKLRTLSFWFTSWPSTIKLPADLLSEMRCLRVLDLAVGDLQILPDSVGRLKHLRCIDLRETSIGHLPESLCTLYFLQTLKLKGCQKLKSLPDGITNLLNLRHLEAESELVSEIAEIGRLKNLQHLEVFSMTDENRNKIGDLKKMAGLRGNLCIQGLERVKTEEEAQAAALGNLSNLEALEMRWNEGERQVIQSSTDILHPANSVMEGLQPPQLLKALTIKSYPGTSVPSWMIGKNVAILSRLESLKLDGCTNISGLSLGQQHSLRDLTITNCPQLRELSLLPPEMKNFTLWDVPELKDLPPLPLTLSEVTMKSVGLQTLPELHSSSPAIINCSGESSSSNDCSGEAQLSVLRIHSCPHLTTLDKGLLKQQHLKHLKVLIIEDCPELVKWPEGGGFRSTFSSSLGEKLSIKKCPNLDALPEGSRLHPTLKSLCVEGCPRVPDELMLGQVHNVVEDVEVCRDFDSFEACATVALHQVSKVDKLVIVYVDNRPLRMVSFQYDIQHVENGNIRRVTIECPMKCGGGDQRAVGEGGVGSVEGPDCCNCGSLWRRCLRGQHKWTSSLRVLVLWDIPPCATFCCADDQQPLPRLPCLEEIWMEDCGEITWKLLTEVLSSSDRSNILELGIVGSPDLTPPPLPEVIQTLPSLEVLQLRRCPQLGTMMMEAGGRLSNSSYGGGDGGQREDTSSPAAPPPLFPRLGRLFVDDLRVLLSNVIPITSLRVLALKEFPGSSLTADEDEVALGSLAASPLQHLAFLGCPNLEGLPRDLKGLLPNLKVLVVQDCPKVGCLPALPASLEFLWITECPALRREEVTKKVVEKEEESSILLPSLVVELEGEYMRGSYSEFLERRAKWDYHLQHVLIPSTSNY